MAELSTITVHTLRLQLDKANPHHHLLSFTVDSVCDGRVKVSFFAKEEADSTVTPVSPDAPTAVIIPFETGVGQTFCQPSGTGINLASYESEVLSKPFRDVFPVVISAELYPSQHPQPQTVINQAVIEKNGNNFKVNIVRRIVWFNNVRYELEPIYEVGTSAETSLDDGDSSNKNECTVCMVNPKDTIVMNCRHLCLCNECATQLKQLKNSKCPICRQRVKAFVRMRRGD